jgi:oligopeptide transport system substrate-binding protein
MISLLSQKQTTSFRISLNAIYLAISALQKKYPKALAIDLCNKCLGFLYNCHEDFYLSRSTPHMCRIIVTQYVFERKLNEKAHLATENRHLFLRILKMPLQDIKDGKRILGIVIAFNQLREQEYLERAQIIRAIQKIIPGIREVENSFHRRKNHEGSLNFLYLEIKKTRGLNFSKLEIKQLQKKLASELKESITFLSPSLFIPKNEEEVYRNIIQLSHELKTAYDIPQVMITFQEQHYEVLSFTVIVLRVLKATTPSLESLCSRLPNAVHFISESVSHVGFIRKKNVKEAAVFTLEVDGSLFFRKNSSIDLRKARQYLVKALELMLGKFRDYNGGFLSKQYGQLELIKQGLREEWKSHATRIESLFYSLRPSLMQTLLLPQAGKALVSLFIEILGEEVCEHQRYLMRKINESNFIIVMIKTQEAKLEEALLQRVRELSLPSYQFGHALEKVDNYSYLSFICQYPADSHALDFLDDAAFSYLECSHPSTLQKKNMHVLNINFQDGDPPSLNPHIGIDLRCRSLQKAIFEGLMRISPEGVPECAAAESFTTSSCQTIYTFYLRSSQWSNGEEVTAFHFESAWKKAIAADSNCLRPDLFFMIRGVKQAHLGQAPLETVGVRALNRKILQVELESPFPCFLELLAHPLFFPFYDESEEPAVFNGPFIVHTWIRDQSLRLMRNPYYWDAEQVRLSGVEIACVRDPAIALQMYQEGKLDWIGHPFSILPHRAVQSAKVSGKMKRQDVLGVYWLYCNTNVFPLSSSKIRRALAYAIHRRELCDHILIGQKPSLSPIPKSVSLLKAEDLYTDGDLETANQLFEEGLKELHLTRKSFPLLTIHHSHITGQKQLTNAIRKYWHEGLGIRVQSEEMDWNKMSGRLDSRQFQIGGCFRHFFYSDPTYVFNLLNEPSNAHNASGWENARFREIVRKARHATTPKQNAKYMRQAEKILIEEMPVIPIHLITYQYLTRNDLQGIHICNSGDADFKWAYFGRGPNSCEVG